MTQGETYELKRTNFISKSTELFHFLVTEFGFNSPVHQKSEQPNGVVIRDVIEYEKDGFTVQLLNAYHPRDYGFELNITPASIEKKELFAFVLKEDQDVEQSYLEGVASRLRVNFN